MKDLGEIVLTNKSSRLVVDIEGIIGVPEWWQFDTQDERVATYERFREKIGRIAQSGATRVTVNIRSIGGDLNDALLIYETLCGLEAEITTCCYGYVASAATVIAQAASPDLRLISPHSLYLIHNSITNVEGNKQEAERAIELLVKTDERIAQLYARRAGRPVEQFRELMGRDGGHGEWLTAEEVIEYGLADRLNDFAPLKNLGEKVRNFFGWHSGPVDIDPQRKSVMDTSPARGTDRRNNPTHVLNDAVVRMQRQLEELRYENSRLKAGPTLTRDGEDPTLNPFFEILDRRGNFFAYREDADLFRS